MTRAKPAWKTIRRGQFSGLAYRLGCTRASAALSATTDLGSWTLAIKRGVVADRSTRQADRACAALCLATGHYQLSAQPPGEHDGENLAAWACRHLEREVDSHRAAELAGRLTNKLVSLEPDLGPPGWILDSASSRLARALRSPVALDDLWRIANVPRFRLLCFLHAMRCVGALRVAPQPASSRERDMVMLGAGLGSGPGELRRHYRARVRALHPDLRPGASEQTRRDLEKRLVDIAAAYQRLRASP